MTVEMDSSTKSDLKWLAAAVEQIKLAGGGSKHFAELTCASSASCGSTASTRRSGTARPRWSAPPRSRYRRVGHRSSCYPRTRTSPFQGSDAALTPAKNETADYIEGR